MSRFHHGCAFADNSPKAETFVATATTPTAAAAQPATEEQPRPMHFGFLFPNLQNEAALLTPGADTVEQLTALGVAMDQSAGPPAADSLLPSIFTYFGQFIAHDISWEKGTRNMLSAADIRPREREQVEAIEDKRTGNLDLDCVYGDAEAEPPLADDGTFKLSPVAHSACRPPNKDDLNDVPRKKQLIGAANDPEDREALIGDPRNDENTIISQLHVAFLRAHNNLMKNSKDHSFAAARTALTQLYQTIVLEDYLTRIIRPDVLDGFRAQPDRFYNQSFMPVEFSAAAFRFGHTMIRSAYALNLNFQNQGQGVRLLKLFSMPPSAYATLPEGWIIEWERFVDGGSNLAHQINTQLVEPLAHLSLNSPNNPFTQQPRLAVRDLLRGYIFRLPSGQSVANAIGVEHEIITPAEFQELLPESQWNVLRNSELRDKTPLWFYILAEAAREKERNPDHDYLGSVGSHIVGGVLMGILYRSTNSVLKNGKSPLGSTLKDLLRLGGVLSDN
jgi:hypothetical protein